MTQLEQAQIRGRTWLAKVNTANTYFNKWERQFRCKKMVKYFEGQQWDNDPYGKGYVLNLIYSTIEAKEPSLIFENPKFSVSPKPSGSDFNPEEAFSKALIATDTLNTLIGKDQMAFSENVEMSLHDSFFRFGMVEVGYDASWRTNPNAPKPSFKNDLNSEEDPGIVDSEPPELPAEEWIFVKRIPPDRFRIGTNDSFQLDKCNWVGYYEYMRLSDIKAKSSGFKNTEDLPEASSDEDMYLSPTESGDTTSQRGDLVKVWKLWDLRSKKHFIICEVGSVEIFSSTFKRLPLFGLRYTKRTQGWLPIPPVFNWKSAQDEQNECKEQMRTHRRRSKRAFQVPEGGAEVEEVEKLIEGADGVTIFTKGTAQVTSIQNTPADPSIMVSMQTSKDDFHIVAGTSGEQQLQADRATATQSTIINNRATLRESKERNVVAKWLNSIGKEILFQAIEKLSKPVWVKLSADTGAWGGEYQSLEHKYNLIYTDYLAGAGFNIDIQLSSMSPIANDEEMNRFLRLLSVLTQFPLVSLHPDLIRETSYRLGYRNEKVIKYLMEAAQLAMIGKIEENKQKASQLGLGDPNASGPSQDTGAQGGNIAQRTVNNIAPPEMATIANQLGNIGIPGGVQQ